MNTEKKPASDLMNYINQVREEAPEDALPPAVAHLFPSTPGAPAVAPGPPAAALDKQPQEVAKATPTASAPAPASTPAPSADLEQPAAPVSDDLATTTGKRPLAHFGQALPATKSKANRKLVLQLTPEMYQYLAHVSTLPGLDGVPLSDLAVAVLQAWREDYRPEIKKANAAFKA